MLKRFVIVSLVLLLAGAATLGWIFTERRKEQKQAAFCRLKYSSELDEYLKQYNEWLRLPPEEQSQLPFGLDKCGKTKTKAQLLQEQQERLKADLDKLAVGETDVYPFADVLYGENWRKELSEYKRQKERKEFIFTGSIVCTSLGGTVFVWCLLLWMARLVVRVSSRMRNSFIGVFLKDARQQTSGNDNEVFRRPKETRDKKLIKVDAKKDEKNSEQEQQTKGWRSKLKKHLTVLINSGWWNFNKNCASRNEPASSQTAFSLGSESYPGNRSPKLGTHLSQDDGRVAMLLSDEKYVESEGPLRAATEDLDGNMVQLNLPQSTQKVALSDSREGSLELEDSLTAQSKNLEKHMTEFRQIAQSVQQTTLENSEPLNSALKELTQEVSAIREYAAYQQNRVEKLQDGYDWNIIRTFCLRVIRCIDNLESRIGRLAEHDIETADLEEVRDELLFALESSGVEQFEPEINSNYRGQEKCAEAVKQKERCGDPERTGKIAKVIRPGYQYFIGEDNVKVVRTAQVKLYG